MFLVSQTFSLHRFQNSLPPPLSVSQMQVKPSKIKQNELFASILDPLKSCSILLIALMCLREISALKALPFCGGSRPTERVGFEKRKKIFSAFVPDSIEAMAHTMVRGGSRIKFKTLSFQESRRAHGLPSWREVEIFSAYLCSSSSLS